MTARSPRARAKAQPETPPPVQPDPDPTPAAEPVQPEETPVMSTETEAPPVETESADAPAEPTETAAPAEIDLTEFNTAAAVAVTARDEATGEVPREQLDAVRAAFHKLDGLRPRNLARKALTEALKVAIRAGDAFKGRAVMDVMDALSAAPPPVAVDPAEAFKQRLIVAHLAYALVVTDMPADVDSEKMLDDVGTAAGELTEAANTFYAWLKADPDTRGDEPDADDLAKQAARTAVGKPARTPHTGKRGNVVKHLVEVVGRHQPGTFLLMRELQDAKSEEYPDGVPGSGALHGRLFPKEGKPLVSDLAGILAPGKNADGKAGVTVL